MVTKSDLMANYFRKLSEWRDRAEDTKRHYPQFGPTSCECDEHGWVCPADIYTYGEAVGSGPTHPDDVREAAMAKLS